jgi:putative restriction endonuclease
MQSPMPRMTTHEQAVLDEFRSELDRMSVNKSPAGEAKKKPLLLLIVLAALEHGTLRENKILLRDVEVRLSALIVEHGGRPITHGAKPEQPFYHLRTSPFWELNIPSGLPSSNKKTPARRVLAAPGVFAALRPSVFALLQRNAFAREEVVNAILQRWWTSDDAARIRAELGLSA